MSLVVSYSTTMHGSTCVLHIYCSSKCIDPYVDDDGECSLDTDGDSTPDYRVSTVMDLL